MSRAKSTRSESVYSSAKSDLKLPAPQSVVDLDRAPPSPMSYSMYPPQQAYQPPPQQKSDDGSVTAKTIIGTLLGATAGAAIAYAMTRDSQPSQPSLEPQYTISAAPAPAPAPSRVQEYQGIRAIEAGPAQSFYSDEDASTVYSRSKAPSKVPSKVARASTVYEGTEYYPPADRAESIYSNDSSGIRRTSTGSVYATRDLPVRAIEFPFQEERRQSVPCNPSTFISSFVDKSFHGDDRTVCSSSTIKPRKTSLDDSASHHSSRHSSYSRSSSHHQSSVSVREYAASVKSKAGGSTYSTRSSREVPLPANSIASFRSDAKSLRSAKDVPLPAGSTVSASSYRSDAKSMRSAKDIPLPAGSVISASSYRSDAKSLRSAKDIPLPQSASPSVYLDAFEVDSHVTPDDSISQVDTRRSTTRSHASHRSKSHSHVSHTSKRSSKFDEPVRPSDSVSQVSTNVSRASQRTIKVDDAKSKASSRRD